MLSHPLQKFSSQITSLIFVTDLTNGTRLIDVTPDGPRDPLAFIVGITLACLVAIFLIVLYCLIRLKIYSLNRLKGYESI